MGVGGEELEKDITSSESHLSEQLSQEDLSNCNSFNKYTARKTFHSTRAEQIKKFNNLCRLAIL